MLTGSYASTLEAYAQLYDTVEVNSTFYRIPRITTAQKWCREASSACERFHFTVKAYQGITHRDRFGEHSRAYFEGVREVAEALSASVILFQSPASFQPTADNIRKLKSFFLGVERGRFAFAWEPRGAWLENPPALLDACEECDLIHCVDPFRHQPLSAGSASVAYFRLHGFGTPSMYRYDFSVAELGELRSMVRLLSESVRKVYIFFNNVACYQNALSFIALMNARE
jgi:uncharacterized protein YecE (DUF72 family)